MVYTQHMPTLHPRIRGIAISRHTLYEPAMTHDVGLCVDTAMCVSVLACPSLCLSGGATSGDHLSQSPQRMQRHA